VWCAAECLAHPYPLLREHYPEQYTVLVRHFDQVRRYT
jgi:hypothetical protein